jgi:hypothetical protein
MKTLDLREVAERRKRLGNAYKFTYQGIEVRLKLIDCESKNAAILEVKTREGTCRFKHKASNVRPDEERLLK